MTVTARNAEQEAADQINLSSAPIKHVSRISLFFSLPSGLSNSLFFYIDTRDHTASSPRSPWPYYEQTEHMQTQPRQKSTTLDPKTRLRKPLTANLVDDACALGGFWNAGFFHNTRLCEPGCYVCRRQCRCHDATMAGDIISSESRRLNL